MSTISEEGIRVLRDKVKLFDGFSLGEVARFIRQSVRRTFMDGTLVASEGGVGTRMFIIISGRARVTRIGPSGEEELATLEAGDTVGEMCMVDRSVRFGAGRCPRYDRSAGTRPQRFAALALLLALKFYRNLAGILAGRIRSTNSRFDGISKLMNLRMMMSSWPLLMTMRRMQTTRQRMPQKICPPCWRF